ncbi:TPA: hypothetical protein QDB03_003218 [Burkholderia vietnamiensis]|uniref:Uncharacterized protein n=1 Tax=Burkholderia vietnamiensis TaxID=60552 RepID=A0AAW7T9E3_BURVI|nr:hypothetical protein [Burkholderia vietnamiensis]MCA8068451.1 hypothetical protein [Burkholderia vietnamiensis]MCA8179541.1 hypothetical protein [Burkholderia vietnamiensis]MDN7798860.1 hypothetical protein [Burkholderia vietnamiensis]UEC02748.1 hypothetical protein LK462_12315 [Burkholderia vietnamiensis]HDR9061597.1 hypothetical protein [Burkholderia vietnamiensis]
MGASAPFDLWKAVSHAFVHLLDSVGKSFLSSAASAMLDVAMAIVASMDENAILEKENFDIFFIDLGGGYAYRLV